MLQIAFNCLKERVVRKKFISISANCYRLKMLRKYFSVVQKWALKKCIERESVEEIKRIQDAKYFWHWRKAFLKEREKNQASEFLTGTQLYQIMSAWKHYTQKKQRAKAFYKNVVQRNCMQSCYHAWIL